MANEPTTVIIGNLTGDPELRYTPNGAAVANFSIASTPRTYSKQQADWVDGETLFMRCSLWSKQAENLSESLHSGQRVIATGRLKQRSFETKDGERRTVIECEVDEIGPSLRYHTARTQKNNEQAGQSGAQWGSGPQASAGQQQAPQWGTGQPAQQATPQQAQESPQWTQQQAPF